MINICSNNSSHSGYNFIIYKKNDNDSNLYCLFELELYDQDLDFKNIVSLQLSQDEDFDVIPLGSLEKNSFDVKSELKIIMKRKLSELINFFDLESQEIIQIESTQLKSDSDDTNNEYLLIGVLSNSGDIYFINYQVTLSNKNNLKTFFEPIWTSKYSNRLPDKTNIYFEINSSFDSSSITVLKSSLKENTLSLIEVKIDDYGIQEIEEKNEVNLNISSENSKIKQKNAINEDNLEVDKNSVVLFSCHHQEIDKQKDPNSKENEIKLLIAINKNKKLILLSTNDNLSDFYSRRFENLIKYLNREYEQTKYINLFDNSFIYHVGKKQDSTDLIFTIFTILEIPSDSKRYKNVEIESLILSSKIIDQNYLAQLYLLKNKFNIVDSSSKDKKYDLLILPDLLNPAVFSNKKLMTSLASKLPENLKQCSDEKFNKYVNIVQYFFKQIKNSLPIEYLLSNQELSFKMIEQNAVNYFMKDMSEFDSEVLESIFNIIIFINFQLKKIDSIDRNLINWKNISKFKLKNTPLILDYNFTSISITINRQSAISSTPSNKNQSFLRQVTSKLFEGCLTLNEVKLIKNVNFKLHNECKSQINYQRLWMMEE